MYDDIIDVTLHHVQSEEGEVELPLCTMCQNDFFDHSLDIAAIHCGHTFHLQCGLIQWFEIAQSRTCPQCRIQVGKRTIINKLFFDFAQEEQSVLDAEFLKNELDNIRAWLSQKEREKRDNSLTKTDDPDFLLLSHSHQLLAFFLFTAH
uniref:RING-type domain-containing protein n=1 Tax=Urocitellus parryii TaxID=9999 RepID=A0A8D2HEE8_UROPR